MSKKSLRAVTLTVVATLVAALLPAGFVFAGDADITLTSVMRQTEPVTLYLASSSQVSTFDPQRATDAVSLSQIENMFLGLTNYSSTEAGKIEAELATSWEFNEDGTTWTFTIRDDVPWVHWDPAAQEAEVLRNVTAYDIEYGIKRGCDPRLGSLYGEVLATIIDGCDLINHKNIDEVTDADYDQVNVSALDDTTLEINLQFSAGYFFSMSALWTMYPVPREVIEEYGDDWTELGNIVTNGPFVLDQYVRGVRRVLIRNPYMPADLIGPGNVERVITTVVEDQGTRYALYLDNQIESTGIPQAELQAVLTDESYSNQLRQISDLGVFYFGFAHDKAPFDDVHARRAFSAIVSREAYIAEVETNRGVPMIHFTPPGMFGAVPINEVGVGFDPDFARAEFALAGYEDCEGFPTIDINTFSSAGDWAEFLAAAAERELGCDPNLIRVNAMEFSVLLESYKADVPTAQRPHMWTGVWGPDYPDANNWVFDAGLACESENRYLRACSEVDDLIAQAAREPDPEIRTELYYRIEELFFGPEGEQPIIPLMLRVDQVLYKPWYTGPFETDGLFGGPHYDWRTVDAEAQQAERG